LTQIDSEFLKTTKIENAQNFIIYNFYVEHFFKYPMKNTVKIEKQKVIQIIILCIFYENNLYINLLTESSRDPKIKYVIKIIKYLFHIQYFLK